MGAKVIEKHVTLNKEDIGPDHKISSSISELKLIIKNIREIEKICGLKNKFNSKKTKEIIKVARKSIVTNKPKILWVCSIKMEKFRRGKNSPKQR